jgi:hypothetical protein
MFFPPFLSCGWHCLVVSVVDLTCSVRAKGMPFFIFSFTFAVLVQHSTAICPMGKSVGQCKFADYSCIFNNFMSAEVWLILTFVRSICISCLGIGQIGGNFNIFAQFFNADCAKDICQGGRAVDGTKSGGRRDHVLLHPQQFHCVRPWRGYHVSSTMTLYPSVGILGANKITFKMVVS